MIKIIPIVIGIIIALVLIPTLWKSWLHEEKGGTIVKLPTFNAYDNSKFPDTSKLLLAGEYLASIDTNHKSFLDAKESTIKKIGQYVDDLNVVLGDIKNSNSKDANLQKFHDEGTKDLDQLKALSTPQDLKNITFQRALYIIVGDWKLLTQHAVTPDQSKMIDKKFDELEISIPK